MFEGEGKELRGNERTKRKRQRRRAHAWRKLLVEKDENKNVVEKQNR